MVSYFGGTEHVAVVKAGTLDNPNLAPPQAHVFVDTKVKWLQLPADTPAFKEFYEFEKMWPAESYSRLQLMRKLRGQ